MAISIPSFELYGEQLAGNLPTPIHHESIVDRSRVHNWTIRLHRHQRLAQIFCIQAREISFRLGDVEYTRSGQIMLVIPPGVAHAFQFSDDVAGDVISVRLDEMSEQLKERFMELCVDSHAIYSEQDSNNFSNVATLVTQLRKAYKSVASNKTDVLVALVDLIVLYLLSDNKHSHSLRSSHTNIKHGKHELQVESFCKLLEENYSQHWSVSRYASSIGISAPHLTRICKIEMGSPPNDLVRQRRMLEAKRLLEYTGLPISDIATRCGFRDAAFFSRAFKAKLGIPPQHYRKQLEQ